MAFLERKLLLAAVGFGLLTSASAQAQIAPECEGLEMPADYDEQVQQDFLANYYALSTTFSPLHAPIPHKPGRGALTVELAVLPPLGCEKRYVLNYTKTEETNKTPIVPRPRVSYAFPEIGPLVLYAGGAYVPPVPLFGTTNVILSAELGAGLKLGEKAQAGLRFHATSQKTVGEIATPFDPDAEAVDDLYIGSTVGLDLMAGYRIKSVVPYLAVGLTDVSTFFFIGDDGVMTNNYHPYFGPALSLGADALLVKRLRLGGEFYSAPGGFSTPDPDVATVDKGSRYGNLHTFRLRAGVEL